jgi:hypothetical protein
MALLLATSVRPHSQSSAVAEPLIHGSRLSGAAETADQGVNADAVAALDFS